MFSLVCLRPCLPFRLEVAAEVRPALPRLGASIVLAPKANLASLLMVIAAAVSSLGRTGSLEHPAFQPLAVAFLGLPDTDVVPLQKVFNPGRTALPFKSLDSDRRAVQSIPPKSWSLVGLQ